MSGERAALVSVRQLAASWGTTATEAKIRLATLGLRPVGLRGGAHYWTDDVAAALAAEGAE